MADVLCEQITPGLRESECIANIRDYRGRLHFQRVERDYLSDQYLPVGIVERWESAVLVELSDGQRLWVRYELLREPQPKEPSDA